MAVKENVKVEEILDGDDLEDMINDAKETLKDGVKEMSRKINWKLYAKCVAGVVVVGAASIALYKWRKSKKAATTAVVVSTPSSADNTDSQVAPAATVVEI